MVKYEFDPKDTNPDPEERTFIKTQDSFSRCTIKKLEEELALCGKEILRAQQETDRLLAEIAEAKRQLGISIATA